MHAAMQISGLRTLDPVYFIIGRRARCDAPADRVIDCCVRHAELAIARDRRARPPTAAARRCPVADGRVAEARPGRGPPPPLCAGAVATGPGPYLRPVLRAVRTRTAGCGSFRTAACSTTAAGPVPEGASLFFGIYYVEAAARGASRVYIAVDLPPRCAAAGDCWIERDDEHPKKRGLTTARPPPRWPAGRRAAGRRGGCCAVCLLHNGCSKDNGFKRSAVAT
eukprot:COSAG01_NODE_5427_length_4271_cov_2.486098_4_plen_223_part_00